MKNHFFLLLGLLISFNCFASGNAYIKGVVVDSKTKEVMEYVTVGLCKVGEEAPISGTITDYSGAFILTNVEAGNYIVKISFMGYVPQEKRVYVNDNSQVVRLGRIELVEDSQTIEGTEIVAQGTQMRFEVDKKVFNVDQNIASNGGSASEVLSNIPSVEVDNEGEISLRGSSDVTVWINGKASGLTADNRAQILEQLPAESIEKIEVITNPSAKYSPEGTSGIINIVLKKDRKVGYYGSVQAGADSRGGYNASGNINYNSGKWEAYANVGFRRRVNVGGEYTNRINLDENGDSISYINQESESSRKGYHLFGRAGTTYNFSNNDHLSLDVMGMFGKSTNSTVNDYIGNVPTSYLTSTRETASDGRNFGGNASLTYKHEFGNDHNLTLSASYFNWNMKNQSHYSQYSLYPNDEYISSYQLQKSVVGGPNWEFQADYVYKISDKHKIEAGYTGEIS
ncbi:MAG: TonB-dependent receptor, partial [Bacteroidales bacterium]|nr:TonB-dependent receptor [Bacteroidales bacterium]